MLFTGSRKGPEVTSTSLWTDFKAFHQRVKGGLNCSDTSRHVCTYLFSIYLKPQNVILYCRKKLFTQYAWNVFLFISVSKIQFETLYSIKLETSNHRVCMPCAASASWPGSILWLARKRITCQGIWGLSWCSHLNINQIWKKCSKNSANLDKDH